MCLPLAGDNPILQQMIQSLTQCSTCIPATAVISAWSHGQAILVEVGSFPAMIWAAGKVCGIWSFSIGWKLTAWFTNMAGFRLFTSPSVCPLLLCVRCWLRYLCSLSFACAPWETQVVCGFVPSALHIQGRADEEESWSDAILCALWQLLQALVSSVRHLMNRKWERGGSFWQESLKPLFYRSFAELQIAVSLQLLF